MITAMSQKFWLLLLTANFGFTFLFPSKIAIAQVKIEVPGTIEQPDKIAQSGTRNNKLPNTLGIPTRTIQSGTRLRLNLPPVGAPGRRIPGATRGSSCFPKNQRLTALLPKSNIGLTTVANPNLYFFIPQTSASQIELVVLDENEQIIYQQNYKPSPQAGIVGLKLPPKLLAVNKAYTWYLSIICDPQNRELDKSIAGNVQRVNNPSLMKKVNQATPEQRLLLYAEAGIWHDALDTLVKLRYTNPNNAQLTADWEYLLTAPGVELDKQLVQLPLISQPEALQPLKSNKLD
jgi:hypothetical protein